MELARIRTHWGRLAPELRQKFPRGGVPDILPRAALWDRFVARLARQNDLTRDEVVETITDHGLTRLAIMRTRHAA